MYIFFFNATATTAIYTLSLHDALPILTVPDLVIVAASAHMETHPQPTCPDVMPAYEDRKSTRLNSSHGYISYAVFCLKKKTQNFPGFRAVFSPAPTDVACFHPWQRAPP